MAPFRFANHRGYKKLRKLAASFPETAEVEAWGHPTFRVRDKIFASFGEQDDRPTIGVKSTLANQAALTAGPDFFVPKYVGHRGWVGLRLDVDPDWAALRALVEEAYRLVAPRKLVTELETELEARADDQVP